MGRAVRRQERLRACRVPTPKNIPVLRPSLLLFAAQLSSAFVLLPPTSQGKPSTVAYKSVSQISLEDESKEALFCNAL